MRTTPLQPQLVEAALSYARGDQLPVQPADAATVVLVRDSTTGLEVYLLHRHAQMVFASGMHVFPGGRVDPRDRDADIVWAGPSGAEWGVALDCDADLARALVCAAVRETFEESGVLLAGPSAAHVVGSTSGSDWEADRRDLVARTVSLTEFLARRQLVLRSDLLIPWAHWITPEFEPRRYDTRFFVTTVPVGQDPRDVSGEADEAMWLTAAEACRRVDAGSMQMLPPTYLVCDQIAALGTTEAVLSTRPKLDPMMPRLEFRDGEAVLVIDSPSEGYSPRSEGCSE
jgi:8-oxo-dGTP pyrophosphatase MutT (NUDIX family)